MNLQEAIDNANRRYSEDKSMDGSPQGEVWRAPSCCGDWKCPPSVKYELVEIRNGHVFAWLKTPSPQSQYLDCVLCGKQIHELFPHNASAVTREPGASVDEI
jgi:hypothetical protein